MGGKKITNEEFIRQAREVHGDRYDYSKTEYKRKHDKVEIICPEHGSFWQVAKSHLVGYSCKMCSASEAWKKDTHPRSVDYLSEFKKVHGDYYDYSKSDIKTGLDPIQIICPEHGEFEQIPKFHKRGGGCPKCGVTKSAEKRSNNIKIFVDNAREVHGDRYDYSKVDYEKAIGKIEIVCPEHGSFWQTPNNHVSKIAGCPRCSKCVSTAEREIKQFISQELHLDTRTNDRLIIRPKELDIVVPSRSLAIEFNGLYWHNESQGKDRHYHLSKTQDCEAAGYRLLHIYEDEWRDKPGRIKSLLTRILRPDMLAKYNARSLSVCDVDRGVAQEFLDSNHIQGFKNSSVRLGLKNSDYQLVAYIGMSSRPDGWHIERFATVGNVRGGFSKLLTHFKHNYEWKKIISFADRRYSQGDVYNKTGFTLESVTQPGYDYTDGFDRINRQSMMKHKMKSLFADFDPSLTERENASNNDFYRIWNCGMYKFVKENHMNLRIDR